MLDVLSWMGLATGGRRSAAAERAHEMVERGAILLDVRTREEFASGHLAGAVNVPVGELPARAPELAPAASGIVVYCRSGAGARRRRSCSAARATRCSISGP